MSGAGAEGRGRAARKPWEVPPLGWKDTMLRTKDELKKDHVSLIAAGGAFFSLLAPFPAVAAVVAIWGLVAEPSEVVRQLDGFTSALPDDIAEIVHDQARKASQEGSRA